MHGNILYQVILAIFQHNHENIGTKLIWKHIFQFFCLVLLNIICGTLFLIYHIMWLATWLRKKAKNVFWSNRTGHGTMDRFQIGKGAHQGCILSCCLFNLYAEYIMWNAGLDETQVRVKIAGRNISNLSYADDTTLMAESEEELTATWWKWKRRVKKLA